MSNQLILYRIQPPVEGRMKALQNSEEYVQPGKQLHTSLEYLLEYAKRDSRELYIARVKCSEHDVLSLSNGWFVPKKRLQTDTPFYSTKVISIEDF